MKRIVILIVLLAVLATAIAPVFAGTSQLCATATVNVRSSPKISRLTVAYTLTAGECVAVIGRTANTRWWITTDGYYISTAASVEIQ